jgi:hypothetical protein
VWNSLNDFIPLSPPISTSIIVDWFYKNQK